MSKKKSKSEPPLEYRFIFVQFVRRQRSRYNPSYRRFERLPAMFQQEVIDDWQVKHPRMKLPELKLSDRPKKKEKK